MYTIKNALLLKGKYGAEIEITVLFMDMRTNAKEYEEFYQRARNDGIKFVRGMPAEVELDPITQK